MLFRTDFDVAVPLGPTLLQSLVSETKMDTPRFASSALGSFPAKLKREISYRYPCVDSNSSTAQSSSVTAIAGTTAQWNKMGDPEELYSGKPPLMDFIGRNSKQLRRPEILAAAKELKLKYNKVGAIGYCYGGWAVFQLGEKGNNLVDCISTAHPSFVDKREIEMLGVPIQILAPETDTQLTPELKEFCNRIIPTLGLDYAYEFFPGLAHGFATRGDPEIQVQKNGLERAKNSIIQ